MEIRSIKAVKSARQSMEALSIGIFNVLTRDYNTITALGNWQSPFAKSRKKKDKIRYYKRKSS